MRSLIHFTMVLLALVMAAPAPAQNAHSSDKPTRLILKDGSYQPAVRYEMKGDRVRYLSAERYEWEEIPASLIDWAATEQYAKDRASGKTSAGTRQVDAEAEAERKAEEARSPQVAPGIRLPNSGGIFLLDVYNNQPQLAELVQNGSQINRDMGRNILRATINPLASAKQSIELKGAHARVQSHVADPFIYVDIDQDQDPSNGPAPLVAKDRFRIVRADIKKDTRVVGNIKVAVYGKVSQEQRFIPTTAEVLPGSTWIKIVPAEPMAPGEYALVEMLDKGQMNLYVWDFGVNPSAPQNPDVWKPEPVQPNLTGTDQSPVLNPRKK